MVHCNQRGILSHCIFNKNWYVVDLDCHFLFPVCPGAGFVYIYFYVWVQFWKLLFVLDVNNVSVALSGLFFQATDTTALSLVFMAVVFAFVPLKYLILLVFHEAYTREMPLRKNSSERWLRRMREWWFSIPAAPVQLIKPDDKKRKWIMQWQHFCNCKMDVHPLPPTYSKKKN